MFSGIGTAIITPFKNGEIDYHALKNFLETQRMVDAIILLGTTGEAPNISIEERDKLIPFVREYFPDKPLIVGVGTNSSHHTMELVKNAEKNKADALLVVTPYYNKPTQIGLYHYYKYISEHTDLEIIIYNVPGRTGVNIAPETVYKLASDCKNITALKEANSSFDQINKVLHLKPETFKVFSGNDDISFQFLASGGNGVISVASNVIPNQMVEMYKNIISGNISNARKIFYTYYPLFKALFIETNPIPVKQALNIMGLIENELRLPLYPANKETKNILEKILKECKII
ncbi:4-hydroxy-tetrahydrodipicolinate synthase [Thermosipho melanesiensis]|uniref:4-hydroxy-tetrahydrodipicolinate synthase n=2 Tax=Thermosipho melanesiensis TaxID=46541 RepID=DAPA_THEM4|nr:4-hydroxy-tetrahydrodipicolinate synthase [Thermosipho melanesiensis]A6LP58.1 RecName: Full=4-hydroxy-tetrahydrodipicolinate synthase; Short=HTPA synthase [Thermosipho melanesiensis BI429]ABR31709.1 dihydrodipicolinate synthase [Thermosipho melanesiensis BI429]APT74732.1 4-hydroxy-tetrahydrodipicolinate synthase [Thermosipho melanesiensis]OOC35233.1 4-hydroxy-tetrahydrodipicolinate synthase [Thermosipho melanesiensis]OOC35443.1 4-hydroxy-tetrahydrodipicolinate synthase [Thermosipho melanesi